MLHVLDYIIGWGENKVVYIYIIGKLISILLLRIGSDLYYTKALVIYLKNIILIC